MRDPLYDSVYPNGINTSYTYDNLNRLTRLKADLGATPVTDFQYLYDAAGNRTRKQQLDYTEDYSYDPLYRLTGVERTAGLTGIWHHGYDAVGNRLTNQINDSVLTAAFNEKNQLTSSSGGGTLKVRGTLNEPGTAKVNGNPARMLAGNVFEATIQATTGTNTFAVEATDQSGNVTTKNYQVSVSATGATYTYDLNGNLTQKVEGADTWAYTWDAEDRLKKVEKNGVEQARFAYDPQGRRVEKVAGGVTTSWTYDDQDILREVRGATSLKFVHGEGIDEPLATEDGAGTLAFLHADGSGSMLKHTNLAGGVSSSLRYDAFGSLELGTPAPHGYTGREWDAESGLGYYRARYYSPRDARFLSEDPMGFNAGVNFYAYVMGNPTTLRDPDGLFGMASGLIGYPVTPSQVSPPNGECFWECVKKQVGWGTVTAAGGAAAGAPLVSKRFRTPGTSGGTSVASKVLSKCFPQKLPWKVPAPTLMRPGATSNVAGRVLGRWVPWVSWAFLSWDWFEIMDCRRECFAERCPSGGCF